MIKLENISKHYNGTGVLNNITLEIESESTSILIGPSGCGKSTLIRIIAGLIKPSNGKTEINSVPVTKKNINGIRKNIGYVIQEGGLFPHLSGYDNIVLAAKYYKWKQNEIDARVKQLSELTGLDNVLLDKYPTQLSGGQRQRISLMRALMLDPQILLLDEPLGALDPLIRFDLQKDLKEIFNKLGKTVVMVTHDLAEAVYFGDKIILMAEGSIVQNDSPKNLIENPKNDFVKKFVNAQRTYLDFK
ncbi:MAG: ABC transporter ATP-binding protein [Bacteroidetes bacterium]|nr:ABC transporter ATP-binding protein [Bacteroidota bacterium]